MLSQRHSEQLLGLCNLQQAALDNREACLCRMDLIYNVYSAPSCFLLHSQCTSDENMHHLTVTSVKKKVIKELFWEGGIFYKPW